jgi:hypothetical protein
MRQIRKMKLQVIGMQIMKLKISGSKIADLDIIPTMAKKTITEITPIILNDVRLKNIQFAISRTFLALFTFC